MKKLFVLVTLLFSLPSMAATISFTYFGNEGNRQTYYACSYVEDQTQSFLELMGATGIEVYCSGGLSSGGGWSSSPVSIRAKYDLPLVTGSAIETVEVEGDAFNPSCGINVRIIKEVLKTMPFVTVAKKQDSCAFATTNYYYKLNIAR
jgi:hypothetical protein